MELQHITDANGNRLAVVIPIDEWNSLLEKHPDIRELVAVGTSQSKKAGIKPSDFIGTMSNDEAEKLRKYVEVRGTNGKGIFDLYA